MLDAMEERNVVEDEVVIQQGDDGDNFYVIERSGLNFRSGFNPFLVVPMIF